MTGVRPEEGTGSATEEFKEVLREIDNLAENQRRGVFIVGRGPATQDRNT